MKTQHWIKITCLLVGTAFLLSMIAVAPAIGAGLAKERLVRELRFVAYSPGLHKMWHESQKYIAQRLKLLGLQVDFRAMQRAGVLQNIWYSRNYDLGTLYLTGRPTRVDPNMILSKLYHSRDDRIGGYNWAGYHNPDYDKTIDDSNLMARDQNKRIQLIHQAQDIVTNDVPIITIIHQMMLDAYNNQKWTGTVSMIGNGLKNVWNWTQMEPLTDDKTLVVAYRDDAGVLNPLTSHEMNVMVCRSVYDTLTHIGPDGAPRPWLAESWNWISDTEIEFKLRKGHKWHDGKPVTARDVKFTIEFIKEQKVAYHVVAAKPIKEVKVIDDHTVRYILNYPYAPLLAYTGEQIYILPEHIWKDVPDKVGVDDPIMWSPTAEGKFIGSGFLKFDYWRKKDELKLVANKDHFYAPKYDARIFKIIVSAEAALGRLRKGEVDMLVDYNGDAVALKKVTEADPKLTMAMEPSIGWYELSMNIRQPPLDDPVLRRAIAAVIPRDVIAKNIWKGFAIPAYSPTHQMLKPWYNPAVTVWEKKLGVEGAKKMLKEAGYAWDSKGLLYYPEGKNNQGWKKK
jgi:peptide/nickel transport system substrate-binding protein